MKFEDTNLNATERASAEKWLTKHRAASPSCADADFEVDAITGGYGYKMKIVCLGCGQREDVTDPVAHGGYPHK